MFSTGEAPIRRCRRRRPAAAGEAETPFISGRRPQPDRRIRACAHPMRAGSFRIRDMAFAEVLRMSARFLERSSIHRPGRECLSEAVRLRMNLPNDVRRPAFSAAAIRSPHTDFSPHRFTMHRPLPMCRLSARAGLRPGGIAACDPTPQDGTEPGSAGPKTARRRTACKARSSPATTHLASFSLSAPPGVPVTGRRYNLSTAR